ncbi:hypothetical protein [Streptomyces sp. HNM0574]|uniref:hypothetical protein n=1 Tax=Streptomyces sp. HNM0574 TaxID=2714954 RepID=UPI00146A6994|nr:hypothetical protein [Streptomyces sp. HNM0574]NLU68254.1 hypothetical protein [Streptomyces sp. HNM0574]
MPRSLSFHDILRDQESAWCDTAWKPVDVSADSGAYHGSYRVDIASDVEDGASYRPLLHASLLAELVNFHTLASIAFAYSRRDRPELARLPDVPLVEFRRRALLTSLQLSLVRPVFDSPVPMSLTVDDVTDKWKTHRLMFFNLSVEVAEGKQTAKVGGCLNFRDAISPEDA